MSESNSCSDTIAEQRMLLEYRNLKSACEGLEAQIGSNTITNQSQITSTVIEKYDEEKINRLKNNEHLLASESKAMVKLSKSLHSS